MAELSIFSPPVSGAEYDVENPTKNTEVLSAYLINLFSALSQEGFVISDGQVREGTEEDFILDALWNAQTKLLQQQQQRFESIGTLLQAKTDALPSEEGLAQLIESFIEGGTQAFIAWLLPKIAASSLGAVAGGIIIPLTLAAIQTLRETYLNGKTLVSGMVALVDSLTGDMPRTKENYEMRSRLIEQNERQLANYLNEMMIAEQGINGDSQGGTIGLQEINKTLLMIAQNDASIVCPHTGEHIYRKSLIKIQ